MITPKIKRLRRKITKNAQVYEHNQNLSITIPQKIRRNLKIEKGDIFEFVTDRKKEIQKFRIIKIASIEN